MQRSIRDLLPLAEHPKATQPQHCIAAADQSIVLHSAHSLVRELEVLHDHLLTLLAAPPPCRAGPAAAAQHHRHAAGHCRGRPAIRAVFGLHAHNDPRRIPFAIADLAAQAHGPLVVALQWLLRLPQQRCHFSDLASLLDVPAVAARLGLEPADAPLLRQWMAQAGIRWGLNAEHRRQLDLAACRRRQQRLVRPAARAAGLCQRGRPIEHDGLPTCADWQGMAPLPEVEGLSAHLAGILAALLACLQTWWQAAQTPAPPQVWAQRLAPTPGRWLSAPKTASMPPCCKGWSTACKPGCEPASTPALNKPCRWKWCRPPGWPPCKRPRWKSAFTPAVSPFAPCSPCGPFRSRWSACWA